MRIVSLLPSTTEIICALGLESDLVGRSHECDYPESVRSLPACTAPKYKTDGTSYQIDQRVRAIVQEGLSVYRVDADLLAALEPDLVLTQDHCEVCAASYAEVKKAVDRHLEDDVKIVSVSPTDLDEIFLSIQQIADAAGAEEQGTELIQKMTNRFNELQSRTENLPNPQVLCVEWIDPLMTAGNWFPELAEIAGGNSLLSETGDHSAETAWERVVEEDPDLLLISPCGYSISQTLDEIEHLIGLTGWDQLRAVRNDRVFVMDGNRYFNRPGPRLTNSTRILAEIFYPGIFEPDHHSSGWINLSETI